MKKSFLWKSRDTVSGDSVFMFCVNIQWFSFWVICYYLLLLVFLVLCSCFLFHFGESCCFASSQSRLIWLVSAVFPFLVSLCVCVCFPLFLVGSSALLLRSLLCVTACVSSGIPSVSPRLRFSSCVSGFRFSFPSLAFLCSFLVILLFICNVCSALNKGFCSYPPHPRVAAFGSSLSPNSTLTVTVKWLKKPPNSKEELLKTFKLPT